MASGATGANRLTQADRSALSERRTLEAAVQLMGERGYEKTTLAAIGEAAGYSRGLATHHFGSKADLFARVIRWISDKLRRQVVFAGANDGSRLSSGANRSTGSLPAAYNSRALNECRRPGAPNWRTGSAKDRFWVNSAMTDAKR